MLFNSSQPADLARDLKFARKVPNPDSGTAAIAIPTSRDQLLDPRNSLRLDLEFYNEGGRHAEGLFSERSRRC
jgi:hypothetical protein